MIWLTALQHNRGSLILLTVDEKGRKDKKSDMENNNVSITDICFNKVLLTNSTQQKFRHFTFCLICNSRSDNAIIPNCRDNQIKPDIPSRRGILWQTRNFVADENARNQSFTTHAAVWTVKTVCIFSQVSSNSRFQNVPHSVIIA